jgi:hypothetical protein
MAPRKPVKWTPEKIAEIEALRAEGKSWRDISKHFGVTSSGGIFTIYHKYKPDGSWRPPAVWQPIATAPKDGTPILAWPCHNLIYVVAWTDRGQYGCHWIEAGGEGYEQYTPTHWMHLPHLPTSREKNNGNG